MAQPLEKAYIADRINQVSNGSTIAEKPTKIEASIINVCVHKPQPATNNIRYEIDNAKPVKMTGKVND